MTAESPRLDVLYVHHGAPRIYDIVAAIGRAGFSVRYASGYYYREDGLVERLLRALPGDPARRALARLKRRYAAMLDPECVDRAPWQDALLALQRVSPRFLHLRNRFIDRRGARLVRRLRPRIVISCDTHALRTLRAAKEIGAVAVLDQVIGHAATANRILADERARRPEIDTAWRPMPARALADCIAEAREADHVLAPSDYVRETLTDIGVDPARISILPYGADTAKFRRGEEPPTPPFRILFAGQIGLRKGTVYLLEAVRRAALPDAELVLLGNVEGGGAWLEPYRGLYTHVRHLPHAEIPAVFASAHVYVYPSLHEGSTVSIYEAMATGLPVIATPNAGSFVRDGIDGFVVPVRDSAALADRLTRLHGDGGLRARLSASARERAGEFTWQAYSRRISDILTRLLATRDAAAP